MIDRLHDVLPYLGHLPPEAQEDAAAYIETLVKAWRKVLTIQSHTKDVSGQDSANEQWPDPFGAWSDLPDTILDDLDQIRHASRPTPPLELPFTTDSDFTRVPNLSVMHIPRAALK